MDQTSFDSFYIRKCAVRHLPLIMVASVSSITLFALALLALGDAYSARSIQALLVCNALVLGIAYACHRMARRESMAGVVASTLVFQGLVTFSICYRAQLDHLGTTSVYYLCLCVVLLGVFVVPNRWGLMASWVIVLGPVIAFSLTDPMETTHQQRHLAGFIVTAVGVTACMFPLIQSVKWGAFRLLVESHERSTSDPLTGLANRMAWTTRVQAWIEDLPGTQPQQATVLYLDLDEMKKINDEYGHPVGDRVLVEVGDILRRVLPRNAIIARFGGDEFVAFLPTITPTHAEPIIASLHAATKANPRVLDHTIGIGVASYRSPEPIDAALHRADRALLQAKRSRRTRLADEQTITETESVSKGLGKPPLPLAAPEAG